MRLATIASALAIVLCVAVFGAIFLQNRPIPTAPAQATPTEGRAPEAAVTAVDNPVANPARFADAPVAVAPAPPPPTPAPLPPPPPPPCPDPTALRGPPAGSTHA